MSLVQQNYKANGSTDLVLAVEQTASGTCEPPTIVGETQLREHTNTASESATFKLTRSRGTAPDSEAIVVSGDTLCTLSFQAYGDTHLHLQTSLPCSSLRGSPLVVPPSPCLPRHPHPCGSSPHHQACCRQVDLSKISTAPPPTTLLLLGEAQ